MASACSSAPHVLVCRDRHPDEVRAILRAEIEKLHEELKGQILRALATDQTFYLCHKHRIEYPSGAECPACEETS